MDLAMSNHIILRAIAERVPFGDMLRMRKVSKLWCQAVNPVLRERALTEFLKHSEVEARIQVEGQNYSNWDLVAEVPLYLGSPGGTTIMAWLQSDWLHRVKRMNLFNYRSSDVNRLIPILVNVLPNLDELEWIVDESDNDCYGTTKLPPDLPDVPTSVTQSPLTSLYIVFCADNDGPDREVPCDVTFMKKCPNLKNLVAMICGGSPRLFLRFVEDWKILKRSVPALRFNHIELELCIMEYTAGDWRNPIPNQDHRKRCCKEIIDFLHANQPSSLHLIGEFVELDFLHHEGYGDNLWTDLISSELKGSSIKELKVDVPLDDALRKYMPHWVLENLRKVPAYSRLTSLVLQLPGYPDFERTQPEQRPVFLVHTLEHVKSLTLDLGSTTDNWRLILNDPELFSGKICPFLPNVTTVTFVDDLGREKRDHDPGFLESLQGFSKLQELQFVFKQEVQFSRYKISMDNETVFKGFLANLGTLKDLQKVVIRHVPTRDRPRYRDRSCPISTMMFGFFKGYTPHCALTYEYESEEHGPRELQFSVTQFQEVLKEVMEAAAVTFYAETVCWRTFSGYHMCSSA